LHRRVAYSTIQENRAVPNEAIPDPAAEEPVEVSVLLVNWNTREMTLECLRSLYAETRRTRFECLVMDNGSKDGSAEAIAREFPQVRLQAETENHGFGKATNLQVAVARAPLVLLLNTDTLVLDGAVDKLVAFARANPGARIWGGRTVFADGSENTSSAWRRITPWSSICFALGLRAMFPGSRLFDPERIDFRTGRPEPCDIVVGCLLLIEKAFWNELGGFDPAFFMYGEETDLCLRAGAAGARPLVTPDATIVHYGGASATSNGNKAVQLFEARMRLSSRHQRGLSRATCRGAHLFAAFLRMAGYSLKAKLRPGERTRQAAEQWRIVWQRRSEWRHAR
jgi:GT2 family glycosyltransferase